MITSPQRRRVRRRLLLYGATAVLCGMTITLTVVSVVSYVRYQQLTANARTAAARFDEAERSTESRLCDPLCLIYRDTKNPQGIREVLTLSLPTLDITRIAVRANDIRLISRAGKYVIADLVYAYSSAGQILIAAIHGSEEIKINGTMDFYFLGVGGHPYYGEPLSVHRYYAFLEAANANLAAKDAKRVLSAAWSGTLLAFFVISTLGWIATRRRLALRRAPPRGTIDGGVRPQPSCDLAWTDKLTTGLIASAVHALDHLDDQNRYCEEWAADSEEIPDKWQRLRWALLLRLFAPMGIRSARHNAAPSMSPPQQQQEPVQSNQQTGRL
jgi:hypothetical protein